ncbi:bifunctional phosphoribosyl-AMP cyclohydrolase/phosphoribosyl-ATP pyrophosphatase [Helicobacter monodelphidis]|uniref:bifunctional phosphoribosyl-AMP cyclohydrolase/phosphoribosyl-ATP diphosphatase HisIE n=1 Tax=Helicobacter sp. 15-1451 TaxID=2004995 RepID=UPI000DCB53F1|nr:bifunctional phosphoribosyl-AMP cyclohydrolase/phosphoribosyl-ATP diphosphatase HisIE [Helicobacter sp. 15-1451]RAX57517.1 bifunctional phosphoribosyl-AMP cyclohydrolase/phosphoribosyl-ATP pyrophosphatase [Helicobacter sp. 15-1451]
MENNDSIDWVKTPLIPAIAQDIESKEVLLLAYMNQEALDLTLQTGEAHYFSRSKQRIWRKGESSGHTQKVERIWLDCDNDTILLQVHQKGVACHTMHRSCFFRSLDMPESEKSLLELQIATYGVLDTLYHQLLEKKSAPIQESYTAQLLKKGDNEIGKKIIEEAAEFTFALKDNKESEIIYECADLFYHTLVGLVQGGISPDRVFAELQRRMGVSGLVEKANRKQKE